jgi:hypothetical protein
MSAKQRVFIVQKRVAKLSNTSTMLFPPVRKQIQSQPKQNKQTNKQTKQIFICRTLCFNIKLDTSSTMVCTNTVKHDNIVKNLEAGQIMKKD